MKRKISNEEFNTAYTDINNTKIINKVKQKYRNFIPEEEIKRCGMIALWKSLQDFDPERGRKFSSYLYKMTTYEYNNWISRDRIYQSRKPISIEKLSVEMTCENFDEFADIISMLPKKLAKIVELKFLHNMSLEEIGKKFKFSHETTRRKLQQAYAMIKEQYDEHRVMSDEG